MKQNDFDRNKNYYKELYDLHDSLQTAVTEFDTNLIKGCISDTIESIKENGNDENKADMTRFIIETSSVETLNERALFNQKTIFGNLNYSLGCFDSETESYNKYTAYFKFFNHRNEKIAPKVARITFLNPSYIHHIDPFGKEEWELNKDEKKDLNKILHKSIYGQTVWYWLTYEFYVMTGLDFDFGTTVPDYTTIRKNVDKEFSKNDNTNIKSFRRGNK